MLPPPGGHCREDLSSTRQGALHTRSHDPWRRHPAWVAAARCCKPGWTLEGGAAMMEGAITASPRSAGCPPHWERAAAGHSHALSGWAGACHTPDRHVSHTLRLACRLSGRRARPGADEGLHAPRGWPTWAPERGGQAWASAQGGHGTPAEWRTPPSEGRSIWFR